MRARLILFGFLSLLVSCFISPPSRPSPPLSGLLLPPEVAQAMLDIQAYFPVETARCLHGERVGNALQITSMTPAWVNSSDSVSVSFKMCSGDDVIGWYHNHPILLDSVDICYPSRQDLSTLVLSPFKVGVLTCTSPGLVVWSFSENPRHLFSWRWPAASDET